MGFWAFVFGTSLVLTAGWVVASWIRAKHGHPMADDQGHGMTLNARQQIERLSGENSALKAQLQRLEERLSVVETIVTDPAERTAREIDRLR